jgi:histidinol-phosphatase (PHP family)
MHSRFSDGKGEPSEFLQKALAQGMFSLGFSEHAPLEFPNSFALKSDEALAYVQAINELKQEYAGSVDVFCGLEMDYIPGITEDFSKVKQQYGLDFLIGSVHLVANEDQGSLWFIDGALSEIYDAGLKGIFGNDIRKAVSAFYHQTNEMIQTQEFDILGHFDKIKMHNKGRFFKEEESWYRNLVSETIRLIAEKGIIVEVNTRGIYKKRADSLFPGIEVLKEAREYNIPLTLSSDAHNSDEMAACFPETLRQLDEAGIRELWYLTAAGWTAMAVGDLIS